MARQLASYFIFAWLFFSYEAGFVSIWGGRRSSRRSLASESTSCRVQQVKISRRVASIVLYVMARRDYRYSSGETCTWLRARVLLWMPSEQWRKKGQDRTQGSQRGRSDPDPPTKSVELRVSTQKALCFMWRKNGSVLRTQSRRSKDGKISFTPQIARPSVQNAAGSVF
jgi:hypothetical protein